MLVKKPLLLLGCSWMASCSITSIDYTFILCQEGGGEIIGYDAKTKTGGGGDNFGFPAISCKLDGFKCIEFPFYSVFPEKDTLPNKTYRNSELSASFQRVDNGLKVSVFNKNRNIRAQSIFENGRGLIRYNIHQNGNLYKFQRCRGRFDVPDMTAEG